MAGSVSRITCKKKAGVGPRAIGHVSCCGSCGSAPGTVRPSFVPQGARLGHRYCLGPGHGHLYGDTRARGVQAVRAVRPVAIVREYPNVAGGAPDAEAPSAGTSRPPFLHMVTSTTQVRPIRAGVPVTRVSVRNSRGSAAVPRQNLKCRNRLPGLAAMAFPGRAGAGDRVLSPPSLSPPSLSPPVPGQSTVRAGTAQGRGCRVPCRGLRRQRLASNRAGQTEAGAVARAPRRAAAEWASGTRASTPPARGTPW